LLFPEILGVDMPSEALLKIQFKTYPKPYCHKGYSDYPQLILCHQNIPSLIANTVPLIILP